MNYQAAKERYAAIGVDAEQAIRALGAVPVALHCWQGDDVRGFDTDPTDGGYRPGAGPVPGEKEAEPPRQLRHF